MWDMYADTIWVTQQHIDEGVRNDPCRCPLALALTEYHGCLVKVTSEGTTVGAESRIRPLHKNLTDLVESFDRGEKVEPFALQCTKESGPTSLKNFEIGRIGTR